MYNNEGRKTKKVEKHTLQRCKTANGSNGQLIKFDKNPITSRLAKTFHRHTEEGLPSTVRVIAFFEASKPKRDTSLRLPDAHRRTQLAS